MGEGSKIEWTDHTFNPWWGCEKVSPACKHCYAESFAKRTGSDVWGAASPRRFFGEKHWSEPRKWNAAAAKAGKRARVFCASMADVYEDRADLSLPRLQLWELIEATPHLDWLLLTKRPQNIVSHMTPKRILDNPLQNVWYGTTVENQEEMDRRIPYLRAVRGTVRFLSCEPLLGPVKLVGRPDWVICGGESGHGARPMHPKWARDLRDQCLALGIPFHFKQWGDWVPGGANAFDDEAMRRIRTATRFDFPDGYQTWRVGKKVAGRHFDGQTWDGYPSVA